MPGAVGFMPLFRRMERIIAASGSTGGRRRGRRELCTVGAPGRSRGPRSAAPVVKENGDSRRAQGTVVRQGEERRGSFRPDLPAADGVNIIYRSNIGRLHRLPLAGDQHAAGYRRPRLRIAFGMTPRNIALAIVSAAGAATHRITDPERSQVAHRRRRHLQRAGCGRFRT